MFRILGWILIISITAQQSHAHSDILVRGGIVPNERVVPILPIPQSTYGRLSALQTPLLHSGTSRSSLPPPFMHPIGQKTTILPFRTFVVLFTEKVTSPE